jgi:hypothetical protein
VLEGRSGLFSPFARVAEQVLCRCALERDIRVKASEVEQARAFLAQRGVVAVPLADGTFAMRDGTTVSAPELLLLGVRHLVDGRLAADARMRAEGLLSKA